VEQSSKIFTFIDVAGNEKYAKTMIKGICSHYPDYALTVIDPSQPVDAVTTDHIKLAFAFNVPVIVVITKVDKVSQDQLFETQYALTDMLKEVTEKIPLLISNEEDVVLCSRTIQEESIFPVFFVSNTSRKGLDLFLSFLNLLPISTQNQWRTSQDHHNPEFHITETFDKEGEPILSGMVLKGQINIRQQLLLGPDNDGRFRKVEIKGIHSLDSNK
jgi:elongation factor 1-alpha